MNDAGWIGVAFSLVTALGAAWTAWVQRKGNRDKLELDDRFRVLEAAHAHCEEGHAATAKVLAKTAEELDEAKQLLHACEQKHEATDARLDALERSIIHDPPQ